MLCDNLEGRDGVGVGGRLKKEGTYAYLWLMHVVVWQKPIQHCKAATLQLNINFKILKQYCNKFNKGFKNGPHFKKILKKEETPQMGSNFPIKQPH